LHFLKSFEILLRRNLACLLLLEFSQLLIWTTLEKRAEICFKVLCLLLIILHTSHLYLELSDVLFYILCTTQVASSLLSTCDFSKFEAFMKGSHETPTSRREAHLSQRNAAAAAAALRETGRPSSSIALPFVK
jgi:hypothetical protein